MALQPRLGLLSQRGDRDDSGDPDHSYLAGSDLTTASVDSVCGQAQVASVALRLTRRFDHATLKLIPVLQLQPKRSAE